MVTRWPPKWPFMGGAIPGACCRRRTNSDGVDVDHLDEHGGHTRMQFHAHRLVVRGGSFGGFEEHGSGPLAVHMVSSRTAPARAVPPTASELVAVITWPAGKETGRVATNVIEEERESDVRGRRRCCGHRCRVNASFNTSTTRPSECNSLTSTLNNSGTCWKIVLMLDDRLVGLFAIWRFTVCTLRCDLTAIS